MRRFAQLIVLLVLWSYPIFADEYSDEYYGAEVDTLLEGLNLDINSIHQQALEFANNGNLEGALPYFKKATELDGTKDTQWSNLGVTQMRLNLLDDALISFTKGLQINPDSSLINENINALKEHMAYRAQFDNEEEEEEESEPSPPPQKKKVKNIHQPSPQPKQVSSSSSSSTTDNSRPVKHSKKKKVSAEEWFGDWWLQRDELVPVMREAIVNFRPVSIRNFLKPEKALALHHELYHSKDYQVYEQYNRWYQFHFKAIYQHNEHYHDNVLLSEISEVVDLPEVKQWVQEISLSEVNGSTLAGAAHYDNGDYTMPHTDKAGGGGGDVEKRRIAYILHLTKDWNPMFGGDMVWMNPAYTIHPSFNTMNLFSVSQSSWHFVSPVAMITPKHLKRLAFNGWWTSINRKEADEIENKQNEDLRFSTFATVIDGNDGRFIPHIEAYEKLDGLWVNYVK